MLVKRGFLSWHFPRQVHATAICVELATKHEVCIVRFVRVVDAIIIAHHCQLRLVKVIDLRALFVLEIFSTHIAFVLI